MSEKKSERKLTIIVIILLCITLAALLLTLWAVFFREEKPPLTPDYAPQETEEHAETIPGDTGDKLDQPQGGGAVSLTYAREVYIDLSEAEASLLFANPGKSNQDMVVQIVIQEEVIVQSGRLTPGNQVTTLGLLEGAADKLAEGGYDGKFVVHYYDPVSGEKAIVNTEIPLSITVKP